MRTADGRSHTIRNVIWDVDGTLFDTYPAIARAFRVALNELGADAPLERIADLARESLGHCAAMLAADHGLDQDAVEEAFRQAYDRTAPAAQPPFAGVREVCEWVARSGGRNVVVTHRGPRSTAELLESGNLAPFFSDCITHADGFPRKPDPAAFNAVIDRNDLRRVETMAIGDRDIDAQAGRAAGVLACLFGTGDPSADADLVIADFGELLGRLEAPDG